MMGRAEGRTCSRLQRQRGQCCWAKASTSALGLSCAALKDEGEAEEEGKALGEKGVMGGEGGAVERRKKWEVVRDDPLAPGVVGEEGEEEE